MSKFYIMTSTQTAPPELRQHFDVFFKNSLARSEQCSGKKCIMHLKNALYHVRHSGSINICELLTLYHTIMTFNDPEKETFSKHCNQHFLLFPQRFLPIPKRISVFKPLPDKRILNWSKLKQIADNILKCISKWIFNGK